MKIFNYNYNKKSHLALILICILNVIIFNSCAKKDQEVIKIGAILPLTGDGAKYGETARNAIELALEEINSQGGINGHRIKVVYEDSEGLPKQGVSAIQKLITRDKVSAAIGALFSSVTLAIAPVAEQNRVVILSPTSSAPSITDAGDYIFRNVASDIFEGSIMAGFAVDELEINKVAILYINNDYGTGVKDVFKNTFIARGGTVVIEEAFEQSATDYRTQLSKIKAADPNAIYIVGYKELGQLLKQARELGVSSRFLSTVMFEDPDILEIAGIAAEGVVYSSRSYDPESEDRVIRSFVRGFMNKYGTIPDIFAALSYDAMKILALAMEREGFTSDKIKKGLYGIKNYPATVGQTSFDQNGDVIQPAVIKTVMGGKFVKWVNN